MGTPPVRVRMAPSPTGFFHVGGARTALFNWLYARRHDGRFVMRVEDTDQARLVEGAFENALEDLEWLGLAPDEGPASGGALGPYVQSQRLDTYRRHAKDLEESGHAYRCFCSPERLAEVRERRAAAAGKIGYDRRCRDLPAAEVAERLAAGDPSVLRLKMPTEGRVTLSDLLRGEIHFAAEELEDVILVKSDAFPTYHFAVVVDDHLMEISHVMRGDEWVSSAPIQVVLYEAFGWPQPVWAHVPLVLNPDGKGKLSKRKSVGEDGQPLEQKTQVREFRAAGYLPEAMFNFLALQGWSFSGDEEVFTREQAIERFRLEDLQTAPAAWDNEKLDWMNGAYIRALAPDDLARRLLPFLRAAGLPAELDTVTRLAPLVQERLTTLTDAAAWLDFIWAEDVTPSAADLVPKKLDAAGASAVLEAAGRALGNLSDWTAEAIEAALREVASELGLKAGPAFGPVRVAVTGRRVAPPLFETLEIIGRETSVARLAAARGLLDAAAGPDPAS